jgi:hypothetical protein
MLMVKKYLVFFDIANKLSDGNLRLGANKIKREIKREIEIFNHRKISENLYEINSNMEPVILHKILINMTYSVNSRTYLFNEDTDILYIVPFENKTVLNGKFLDHF